MTTPEYNEESKLKILRAANQDFQNRINSKRSLSDKLRGIDITYAAVKRILIGAGYTEFQDLDQIAREWKAFVRERAAANSLRSRARNALKNCGAYFTCRRLGAIYLLWVFANLMLLICSPLPFGKGISARSYGAFYPFPEKSYYYDGRMEIGPWFDRTRYDISEFSFYCLAPLVGWGVRRLWGNPQGG